MTILSLLTSPGRHRNLGLRPRIAVTALAVLIGLSLLAAGRAEAYEIGLRWRAVSSAVSYRIYSRVGTEFDTQTINTASTSNGSVVHIVSGLPLGPTATFSITAVDSLGRESSRSNQRSVTYEMAAEVVDSDSDGLTDAEEDTNLNRLVDGEETDPDTADTDDDGWGDGYERRVTGTDPLDSDSDADGVLDAVDTCHDVDRDGYGAPLQINSTCPIDNCIATSNPDQLDSDQDGRGELCDPCTNVGGERDMLYRHQVTFGKIFLDPTHGNDRMAIKGDFVLPTYSDFALLAPITDGIRLIVESAYGEGRIEIDVPAGTVEGDGRQIHGWVYASAHKTWKYVDRTKNLVNGIRKVIVQDKSRKQARLVRIVVKGRDGDYPLTIDAPPLRAAVVLGDIQASLAGECGESAFQAPDCQFNRRLRRLRCDRKN